MTSLIFSHAKSALNNAKKNAFKIANLRSNIGEDFTKAYEESFEHEKNIEINKFCEILEFSKTMHSLYLDKMGFNNHKNFYFITIRPNDNCEFIDFKNKINEFLSRKCFLEYTYSFEQKGTSLSTLGQGFHVHIIANMIQRSKSEVLRDTLSSWNAWINMKWISPNCIQVDTTKNPNKLINDYLICYKSDDNHKETTKEWDNLWREKLGLSNLYDYPGKSIPSFNDHSFHGVSNASHEVLATSAPPSGCLV